MVENSVVYYANEICVLMYAIHFSRQGTSTKNSFRHPGLDRAASVRSHHGGLPLDHHPEAVGAVSEAIKDLFQKAMFARWPAAYVGKKTWKSSVLGAFSDRMFPLAAQASRRVLGLKGVDISKYKIQHGGILALGRRSLCGHAVVEAGEVCGRCTQMMTDVSRAVLRRTNQMLKLE